PGFTTWYPAGSITVMSVDPFEAGTKFRDFALSFAPNVTVPVEIVPTFVSDTVRLTGIEIPGRTAMPVPRTPAAVNCVAFTVSTFVVKVSVENAFEFPFWLIQKPEGVSVIVPVLVV